MNVLSAPFERLTAVLFAVLIVIAIGGLVMIWLDALRSRRNFLPTPDDAAGRPWSIHELRDLEAATKSGYVLSHIAVYLCRTEQEVRDKAAEIGLPLNE